MGNAKRIQAIQKILTFFGIGMLQVFIIGFREAKCGYNGFL